MPALIGELLVMGGSFSLLFLILWMCISSDKSRTTERYSRRNYLRRMNERKNRYR